MGLDRRGWRHYLPVYRLLVYSFRLPELRESALVWLCHLQPAYRQVELS